MIVQPPKSWRKSFTMPWDQSNTEMMMETITSKAKIEKPMMRPSSMIGPNGN